MIRPNYVVRVAKRIWGGVPAGNSATSSTITGEGPAIVLKYLIFTGNSHRGIYHTRTTPPNLQGR